MEPDATDRGGALPVVDFWKLNRVQLLPICTLEVDQLLALDPQHCGKATSKIMTRVWSRC